jgi:NAD(P)-dependent dehydrogenase (short-subunit alcohol dehydrogenase family)
VDYAATKGANQSFVTSLAQQLADKGALLHMPHAAQHGGLFYK